MKARRFSPAAFWSAYRREARQIRKAAHRQYGREERRSRKWRGVLSPQQARRLLDSGVCPAESVPFELHVLGRVVVGPDYLCRWAD